MPSEQHEPTQQRREPERQEMVPSPGRPKWTGTRRWNGCGTRLPTAA
jgi:hypothetical protein